MTQIRAFAQPVRRRPGALGVHSLDHVNVSVPDMDRARRFYGSFGLAHPAGCLWCCCRSLRLRVAAEPVLRDPQPHPEAATVPAFLTFDGRPQGRSKQA